MVLLYEVMFETDQTPQTFLVVDSQARRRNVTFQDFYAVFHEQEEIRAYLMSGRH